MGPDLGYMFILRVKARTTKSENKKKIRGHWLEVSLNSKTFAYTKLWFSTTVPQNEKKKRKSEVTSRKHHD